MNSPFSSRKTSISAVFIFLLTLAQGIELVIEPESVKDLHPRDVRISCQPFDLNETPMQILMLAIYRQGEKTSLANVYNNKASGSNSNGAKGVKVEGRVDTFMERSFLNVTMFNQTLNAAGNYECQVDYLDIYGNLKTERRAIELRIETPSLDALEHQIEMLVNRVTVLEKGKENFQKQAAHDFQKVAFLKDALKNQTHDSDDKINILKDSLEKEIKSSDEKVLELEKEVAHQQNETTLNEEKVVALANLLQIQVNSNSKKVVELQKMTKELQDFRKLDEKEHQDLIDWAQNLEKINTDQDIKIMSLKQKDYSLEQDLKNEQTQIMNINITGLASETDMENLKHDLTDVLKSSESQIENEVKTLANKHDADKKQLLKQLKHFATNSQLKSLADKEADDVMKLKQNDDKIVTGQKSVKQKIDRQLTNLQLADTDNSKLLTKLNRNLAKKSKSVRKRLNALEAYKSVVDKKFKSLSATEKSLGQQSSNLAAIEMKHYLDLKTYVDTSISQKHPVISCPGLVGWRKRKCLEAQG